MASALFMKEKSNIKRKRRMENKQVGVAERPSMKRRQNRLNQRTQRRQIPVQDEAANYSSTLMKDQIKNWLPMLSSTAQVPNRAATSETRKTDRIRSQQPRVLKLTGQNSSESSNQTRPYNRGFDQSFSVERKKGTLSNSEAIKIERQGTGRRERQFMNVEGNSVEAGSDQARLDLLTYNQTQLLSSRVKHKTHQTIQLEPYQQQSEEILLLKKQRRYKFSKGITVQAIGSPQRSTDKLPRYQTEGVNKSNDVGSSVSALSDTNQKLNTHQSIISVDQLDGTLSDQMLETARKTENTLLRSKLTRKETNAIFDPVDFRNFRTDIEKRKRMQGRLRREQAKTVKLLHEITILKCRSFANLKLNSARYHQTILQNIVRIQRWWRRYKHRFFLTNVLKLHNDQEKAKLKEQLQSMHEHVQLLYNDMQKRLQLQEEEGTRDKAAEKKEFILRQQAANKKAQAVVKFENVMSQMFFRNLAQATINMFLDVKEPLFDNGDDKESMCTGSVKSSSVRDQKLGLELNDKLKLLSPSQSGAISSRSSSAKSKRQIVRSSLRGLTPRSGQRRGSWRAVEVDASSKNELNTSKRSGSLDHISHQTQSVASRQARYEVNQNQKLVTQKTGQISIGDSFSTVKGIKKVQIQTRGDNKPIDIQIKSKFSSPKVSQNLLPQKQPTEIKADKKQPNKEMSIQRFKRKSNTIYMKDGAGLAKRLTKKESELKKKNQPAQQQLVGILKNKTLQKRQASFRKPKLTQNQDVSTDNTLASARDYTKLLLPLVKEEPGTMNYQRRARRDGLDQNSNVQTERHSSQQEVIESAPDLIQEQENSCYQSAKSFKTSTSEESNIHIAKNRATDPISKLKRVPFTRQKQTQMTVKPRFRDNKSRVYKSLKNPLSERQRSQETFSVSFDMVFSAQANSKEYNKFCDEQSQLKNESKKGFNLKDLSHGSRSPRHNRVKTISKEYKEFIQELVEETRLKPEARVQIISDPFVRAFEEYSDILGLYDTINARSYARRDKMVERIKEAHVPKIEISRRNYEISQQQAEAQLQGPTMEPTRSRPVIEVSDANNIEPDPVCTQHQSPFGDPFAQGQRRVQPKSSQSLQVVQDQLNKVEADQEQSVNTGLQTVDKLEKTKRLNAKRSSQKLSKGSSKYVSSASAKKSDGSLTTSSFCTDSSFQLSSKGSISNEKGEKQALKTSKDSETSHDEEVKVEQSKPINFVNEQGSSKQLLSKQVLNFLQDSHILEMTKQQSTGERTFWGGKYKY